MTAVRRRSGIQVNAGVRVPGRTAWVVIPVPAPFDPLSEYGRRMVDEACLQGASIVPDTFFLHHSGVDEASFEVQCVGRDPEDVERELRLHMSVPSALLVGARPDAYLLTGHDETSLLIGQR